MRCYICDKLLEEPSFSRAYGSWDPCTTCLQVVADILAGYLDTPAAEEDAFGEDISLSDFEVDPDGTNFFCIDDLS